LRANEGGFLLAHAARDKREFRTSDAKAQFTANDLSWLPTAPGRLLLQTMRSHDQFNTTIYGLSDRYRGVEGGRQVVFVNPADISALGYNDGDLVDLVTRWKGDDTQRRVRGFRIVAYDTPRGSAAAYYPETNPLVPLDSTAAGSNTPTSKSVVVTLEPAGRADGGGGVVA
jgi:anaerobic selenocysteine-containing dehydrogenase